MCYFVTITDKETRGHNFYVPGAFFGQMALERLPTVHRIFGTYENATIFFASTRLSDWHIYCVSMRAQNIVTWKRMEGISYICNRVGERHLRVPSGPELFNLMRARLMLAVFYAHPAPKVNSAYRVFYPPVQKRAHISPEIKKEFLKNFWSGVVVKVSEQGKLGVCKDIYNEASLNKIVDSPFVEDDLRQIWYYARLKKPVCGAEDIKLVMQICFESILRKWMPIHYNI